MRFKTEVKINKAKFLKDFLPVFEKECQEISDFMQTFIEEEKRPYPRTTIRTVGAGVTGLIADSPRDVVDTGQLRDSYVTDITIESNRLIFEAKWEAPYIMEIYLGSRGASAYPWVILALRKIDLNKVF